MPEREASKLDGEREFKKKIETAVERTIDGAFEILEAGMLIEGKKGSRFTRELKDLSERSEEIDFTPEGLLFVKEKAVREFMENNPKSIDLGTPGGEEVVEIGPDHPAAYCLGGQMTHIKDEGQENGEVEDRRATGEDLVNILTLAEKLGYNMSTVPVKPEELDSDGGYTESEITIKNARNMHIILRDLKPGELVKLIKRFNYKDRLFDTPPVSYIVSATVMRQGDPEAFERALFASKFMPVTFTISPTMGMTAPIEGAEKQIVAEWMLSGTLIHKLNPDARIIAGPGPMGMRINTELDPESVYSMTAMYLSTKAMGRGGPVNMLLGGPMTNLPEKHWKGLQKLRLYMVEHFMESESFGRVVRHFGESTGSLTIANLNRMRDTAEVLADVREMSDVEKNSSYRMVMGILEEGISIDHDTSWLTKVPPGRDVVTERHTIDRLRSTRDREEKLRGLLSED